MSGKFQLGEEPVAEKVTREVERLEAAARSLDAADDALGAKIVEFEETLIALRIGTRVSVLLDDGAYGDEAVALTFDKFGGHWRLLLETGHSSDSDDWSATPLSDVDRETRAYAFSPEHLITLVSDSVGQITERVASRTKLIAETEPVIAALKSFAARKTPAKKTGGGK